MHAPRITHNPDYLELRLVEERKDAPWAEKAIHIPYKGEIPPGKLHQGIVANLCKPTFLDGLDVPSVGVQFEYQGDWNAGTLHTTYLLWVNERHEWVALRSTTECAVAESGEDVHYDGPYRLDSWHAERLCEAYKLNPQNVDISAMRTTSPVGLETLAKRG